MVTPEHLLELARVSDAQEIARLSRTLIETGLPWSWLPQRVAAGIRHPETNVLVARAGKQIAGFGIMQYGEEEAHLNLFAVDRAHQRLGLGHRILDWLEKPARIAGIARIALEVRTSNEAAQSFYEKMGYRKRAILPDYYRGHESAIRMVRLLR